MTVHKEQQLGTRATKISFKDMQLTGVSQQAAENYYSDIHLSLEECLAKYLMDLKHENPRKGMAA